MRLTIINGQLTECKVYGIYNNVDGGFVLDYLELHSNGHKYLVPKEQDFYYNTDNYEKEQPHKIQGSTCFSFKGYYYKDCYYEKDNQLRKFNLFEDVKQLKADLNGNAEVIDGEAPTGKCWGSKEEYLAYHDYTVKKDDGTIEHHKGFLSKLLFDDKQKEIFERLKAVIKEARDAKIMFMMDTSNYSMFAINNNHHNEEIDEWFQSCEPDYETELYYPDEQSLNSMDLFCFYEEHGVNIDILNKE